MDFRFELTPNVLLNDAQAEDPILDFRDAGFLALKNLVYMAEHYPKATAPSGLECLGGKEGKRESERKKRDRERKKGLGTGKKLREGIHAFPQT